MSVTSTEQLDKLSAILYDRQAGRNIIGHAIDTITALRAEVERFSESQAYYKGFTESLLDQLDAMKAQLSARDAEVRALRGFAREFFGRHWNIRSIAIPEVRRLAAKHGLINNVDDAMPTELIRIGGAMFTGEPGPGGEG
jgi:hypothetical protein